MYPNNDFDVAMLRNDKVFQIRGDLRWRQQKSKSTGSYRGLSDPLIDLVTDTHRLRAKNDFG